MLLIVHAALTWMMTGLIWFVQLVHYPLLRRVGDDAFTHYEREHCMRTGWIAGPLMVAEAAAATALLLAPPPDRLHAGLICAGAVLVGLLWVSTFLLQSPQHDRLCAAYDAETQAALVRGNWIRTVLWSVRAVIAAALLAA